MKKFRDLIIAILICQSAGIIGSLFTTRAIPTWYADLAKPSFNPPSWIFGPVWILLYTMMGISAFLIYQKRNEENAKTGLILFAVHLGLNALWSVIFFGLKSPDLALMNIIALWSMILILIIIFYNIDKRASFLLVPYFLWVSFATILNYYIWQLN